MIVTVMGLQPLHRLSMWFDGNSS